MTPLTHCLEIHRQRMLMRAITDPMWLARVLNYDRLTEDFHGPMMREMWNRDLRRPLMREGIQEQVDLGLLNPVFAKVAKDAGRIYTKNEGECWARDHYKTTVFIVRCAKNILLWPRITIAHWHAVEAKAVECSDELGDKFLTNKAFRDIRPDIMPEAGDARFSTAAGFRLDKKPEFKLRSLYASAGKHLPKERHPTFFPKGAGAEVTGGHAAMGWLDDIVGQSTIDDSSMPKVRNWLGSTVAHVIRTDGGWLNASYTPWDEDDVMVSWEKNSTGWDSRVRPCMEDDDGARDYNGTPVLYDKKWIKKKQNDPETNFPYQMMCDRVPDSERRWPSDWDGHKEISWCMQGKGRIFVLSDPAPMGLSLRGDKDRLRGDTGKDWWSISVVRLRVRGDFQDSILLDGSASQSWSDAHGYDEACRLMQKWDTNLFFDEDYQNQLFAPFHAACKRSGVQPYLERRKDGHGYQLPKYKESYIKNAKKVRFQKLCDIADTGAVWISDSCPETFWRGDGDKTGALTQAEKWIPRKGGESSLKWDDHFDSWARSTDSKLQDFAPKPATSAPTSTHPWPWWSPKRKEQYTWGTRHIKV